MEKSRKPIQKLSSALANQIAAGEVVERPASVLKELLENSLDAGSTQIDICIERGGLRLIRVQDNGWGIPEDELKLAIAQHATSKILSLNDLEGVESFGFRGEALASIAAVSRFSLCSWVENQLHGACIQSMGRTEGFELSPKPPIPGTCIEVRDLFYNTPARRKFMRSEKTEMLHLEEIFKKIALSAHNVGFTLWEGERLKKRLTVSRSLDARTRRLASLCGQSFVQDAYYIEAENNGLKISGWLGGKSQLRAQSDLQYFYVNGRIIRDKLVTHAIREAYQTFCSLGRYPAYVLYFELDPKSVDVNVHPTKHEVRFREARTVHAFILYSLQEALKKSRIAGTMPDQDFHRSVSAFENNKLDKNLHFDLFQKVQDVSNVPNIIDNLVELESEKTFSLGKPLSLLSGELLLSENQLGWVIVDIKAVRKEIIQPILQEEYQTEGIKSRPLLLPELIKVGKRVHALEEGKVNFQRLGFDLSLAGPDTILLRGLPFIFSRKLPNVEAFILDILACSRDEQVMDRMIDCYINSACEMGEATQLLKDLEKRHSKESPLSSKTYRQVTLEALRTVLF